MTEAQAADTVIGGWSQYGIKWRSEPVTEKCYYSRNIPTNPSTVNGAFPSARTWSRTHHQLTGSSFSVVNVWPCLHTICHGTLWPEARAGISTEGRSSARGLRTSQAVQPKEVGHTVYSLRHRPTDQHTACLACLERREVFRSERGPGSDSSHHCFRSQAT